MKKWNWVLIGITLLLLVIIVIFALNNSQFNQSLNNLIAGKPDVSCNVDSDCILKTTSCSACSCPNAVNKNWNSFCLNKMFGSRVMCKMFCKELIGNYEIKCIQNKCQIVTAPI